MGYTTEFTGAIEIEPPLNQAEVDYLNKFAHTRRMKRDRGPYFVNGSGAMGQGSDPDIQDHNLPPLGQPGLWCKWVPSYDGCFIEWNGFEKFYDSVEWMQYLIDHFLKPGAYASKINDPQFSEFTFDHVLNGTIDAQSEDPDDMWRLVVKDNVVHEVRPQIIWPDPE
jgi:hypothetical protein